VRNFFVAWILFWGLPVSSALVSSPGAANRAYVLVAKYDPNHALKRVREMYGKPGFSSIAKSYFERLGFQHAVVDPSVSAEGFSKYTEEIFKNTKKESTVFLAIYAHGSRFAREEIEISETRRMSLESLLPTEAIHRFVLLFNGCYSGIGRGAFQFGFAKKKFEEGMYLYSSSAVREAFADMPFVANFKDAPSVRDWASSVVKRHREDGGDFVSEGKWLDISLYVDDDKWHPNYCWGNFATLNGPDLTDLKGSLMSDGEDFFVDNQVKKYFLDFSEYCNPSGIASLKERVGKPVKLQCFLKEKTYRGGNPTPLGPVCNVGGIGKD
jgi:hypothetical protein